MKKIYLYLLLIPIFFTSCEKDELVVPEKLAKDTNPEVSWQKIDFASLPLHIQDLANRTEPVFQEKSSSKTSETSKDASSFGPPNKNIPPVKIINSNGKTSYTLALQKDSVIDRDSLYFDNMVITELDNNQTRIKILRYQPESSWYNSDNRRDHPYSGNVKFFDNQGNLLGNVVLENGQKIVEKKNMKSWSTTCTYNTVTLCTGDVNGGDGMECVYSFEEVDCKTTYISDRSEEEIDPVTGESVGDGGGRSTTTSPIPDEEEEEVINELKNPCASTILAQLELLSSTYDLPEIVDIDPDLESLQFSQAILNMFNEITNTDYIVKEQYMSNPELSGYTDPDPLLNSATGKYEITTYLSSQYLSTATQLSAARSMIHESIHAYLVYHQRLNPARNVYNLVNNYAIANEYPQNESGVIHHNFMAQFVNSIAYNLRLWDRNHGTGGNLGWQYYHDMAWGGLANYRDPNDDTKILFYAEFEEYLRSLDDPTTTNNESSGVKERILNTIENEATNNSNAKGDDCP